MGETFAQLQITNLFTRTCVEIKALVDTGSMHLTVTEEVARRLGFDPEEFSTQRAWLADGSEIHVPSISPIEAVFADRSYKTEALVMGDQCLLGFLCLEAMDLMVDPKQQRLLGRHPGGPRFLAKGYRLTPRPSAPGPGRLLPPGPQVQTPGVSKFPGGRA